MRKPRVSTLSLAVDRFLIAFEDGQGATPATLKTYRWVLALMADRFGSDCDPRSITEDDLLDLVGTWRRLSTSTRAGRISVLRTFWRWHTERYGGTDPSEKLKRPRKQRPARKRLTRDDVEALMRAAQNDRDRLIVYTLAMTGMRRSDLRDLRWRDVNLRTRLIVIRLGKGRKGREVPVPEPLAVLLRDVKARLGEIGKYHPDAYVCWHIMDRRLPSGHVLHEEDWHAPMGENAAYKTLQALALAGDVALPCSPHDLRRFYADAFLEANPGDLFRLQAALGHADIGTTRIYLKDAEMPRVQEAADRIRFPTGDTPSADDLPAPTEETHHEHS